MTESGVPRRVLVTGASGFVGSPLVRRLAGDPRYRVRAASRRRSDAPAGVDVVISEDLGPGANWSAALREIDAVVHLAARVHVMRDAAVNPLQQFRLSNTQGTEALATQAAESGVKRFIYLSSIKVNGEETAPGRPFTERDQPQPRDPYGISKHDAEQALQRISRASGMETVIIRPPLVYGPRVKANFRRMMQLLHRRAPLPFGAIRNSRTLIGLENLVDLIATCLAHPRAANEIFLAGDGEDLSTPDLLRRLGLALGSPTRLIPVPERAIRLALGLIGRSDVAQRLCGSLQMDTSKARATLGWTPPITVDEGLQRVASDFLKHSN